MADFTGSTPAATYKNILQAPSANAGISTSLIQVQDGAGNNTKLWVSTTTTQVQAASFLIADASDTTKLMAFDLSGLTTGNTRTWILPDSSSTFVGTTGTQTLTNKTLTSPVISTIVNTGTLTLPTSTDTLVGRATTDTLTNKTLTSPVIGTIVNTGTLTLPTSTDTLVGRATTDTLTNKSMSETQLTFTDITTSNASSTKHGFSPKSPADATQFLNGATTPAYAQVKDSDLSTTDITTNNVSTTKHGFTPKLPNDATKYLDGTGAYSVPAGGTSNPFHPGLRTGQYYTTPTMTGLSTLSMAADRLYAIPIYIPASVTIIRLGVEITTGAAAGKLIRLGIYNNSTGVPGTLLLDGGTVASDSVAEVQVTVSQAITAGWYWLAAVGNGTPIIRAMSGESSLFGANGAAVNDFTRYFTQSFSFATLPTPFGAVTDITGTVTPFIWFKV